MKLHLDDSPNVESEDVRPGIILDFNHEDRGVGVEILRVRELVPHANLWPVQFELA